MLIFEDPLPFLKLAEPTLPTCIRCTFSTSSSTILLATVRITLYSETVAVWSALSAGIKYSHCGTILYAICDPIASGYRASQLLSGQRYEELCAIKRRSETCKKRRQTVCQEKCACCLIPHCAPVPQPFLRTFTTQHKSLHFERRLARTRFPHVHMYSLLMTEAKKINGSSVRSVAWVSKTSHG